MLTVLVIVIN